jgi:uncharacterized membrane protein YoaK (UPF0700 family)
MSSLPAAQTFRQTQTTAGWRPHHIRDLLLGVLAFAAGSIDVLSWLAVGKVFSAFMTGNVVFLAAGLFSHHAELSLHAALALCAFGVGAWAMAMVMPRQQPSVLWPARATVGLIACALVQLLFWVLWLAVGGHPGSTLMVLLAISAFAMGIQTATAVALGVHAVFTTAVTATWTVLVGDAAQWSATRTERRRLTLVLGGTLLGALAGALLLAHLRLWMPLLPVLLTGGVAVAAHRSVERYVDPARTAVSSALHRSVGGEAKRPVWRSWMSDFMSRRSDRLRSPR